MPRNRRRICFVTGTRAEFGLMQRTLRAIQRDRSLQLQLIATGMHLDRSLGRSIDEIRKSGFKVDATVPWRGDRAIATGRATAGIAAALERLRSDIVLVCGDRVEAFAGAAAGHLSGRAVAHVHGGDRALGQIDDSLRHSITKLSHIHFAATRDSTDRLIRLGEDRWRVHTVGAPGIDGIASDADAAPFAGLPKRGFILLVLHPTDVDDRRESRRAKLTFDAVSKSVDVPVAVVFPNNDPGSKGIQDCWRNLKRKDVLTFKNLPRPQFLAALRDCALLIGNSSAGMIEAASFGTRVIDIGDRQAGRLHSENLIHAPFDKQSIAAAVRTAMRQALAGKSRCDNIYGGKDTARRISDVLRAASLDRQLLGKLITY